MYKNLEKNTNEVKNVTKNTTLVQGLNISGFNPVCINKFREEVIPPRKQVFDPWLPEQGLAMVYAPRGIGKTFFALEIALAIATGGEFLGWKANTKTPVFYIDGEMSQSDLQKRFNMLIKNNQKIDDGYFNILTPDRQKKGMPNLSDPVDQEKLYSLLGDAKVIVIDNISTLCRGGKENDAESWDSVQNWALRLKAEGRTVLFVHHAGKNGGQRGTSKREDVLDTVLCLKRPENYKASEGARFEVHFEKSRGFSGEESKSFETQLILNRDRVFEWTKKDLSDNTYEKVIKLKRSGLKQTDIVKELSLDKSGVSRYVKQAKEEGKLE
jgi:KaiC/GvpD/RAD55 family RecA-like ATPase